MLLTKYRLEQCKVIYHNAYEWENLTEYCETIEEVEKAIPLLHEKDCTYNGDWHIIRRTFNTETFELIDSYVVKFDYYNEVLQYNNARLYLKYAIDRIEELQNDLNTKKYKPITIERKNREIEKERKQIEKYKEILNNEVKEKKEREKERRRVLEKEKNTYRK